MICATRLVACRSLTRECVTVSNFFQLNSWQLARQAPTYNPYQLVASTRERVTGPLDLKAVYVTVDTIMLVCFREISFPINNRTPIPIHGLYKLFH